MDHELSGPVAPAELPQRGARRGVDREAQTAPPEGLGRRPRPVRGQGHGRRAETRELSGPVLELRRERRAREAPPLPDGEVGVLQGELGQR